MPETTDQLHTITKASNALLYPLPQVTGAGRYGAVQCAWGYEHSWTYLTVEKDGTITQAWLSTMDMLGHLVTEVNPNGLIDILQAHGLPLSPLITGPVVAENVPAPVAASEASK